MVIAITSVRKLKISRILYDQLFRASSSIALNTAEGSRKKSSQDQRRYYGIALGSLRECEAILELEQIEDPNLRNNLDRLGAILFTLCKAPEDRYRTETETATSDPSR